MCSFLFFSVLLCARGAASKCCCAETRWLQCRQGTDGTNATQGTARATRLQDYGLLDYGQQKRDADRGVAPTRRDGQPRSQPNLGLGERSHGHRPAAWLSQSRTEYGRGLEKVDVSQKHEMRFFDDFLFLRNTGAGGIPRIAAKFGQVVRTPAAVGRAEARAFPDERATAVAESPRTSRQVDGNAAKTGHCRFL